MLSNTIIPKLLGEAILRAATYVCAKYELNSKWNDDLTILTLYRKNLLPVGQITILAGTAVANAESLDQATIQTHFPQAEQEEIFVQWSLRQNGIVVDEGEEAQIYSNIENTNILKELLELAYLDAPNFELADSGLMLTIKEVVPKTTSEEVFLAKRGKRSVYPDALLNEIKEEHARGFETLENVIASVCPRYGLPAMSVSNYYKQCKRRCVKKNKAQE